MKGRGYWLAWGAITLVSSAYLAAVLTTQAVGTRALFLPGETTGGHYQIELSCESCHTPFGGVTNEACAGCHGAELTAADDSHPKSKFTDPRNAELVARLDATRCATCHREHAPEMTRSMGVTMPDDFCVTCHAGIGRDRPSHTRLTFDTCASAGCHNYHDNTALYEDFLVAHAGGPPIAAAPLLPARALRQALRARGQSVAATTRSPLPADAPPGTAASPTDVAAWETAVHARAGVNCTGCHSTAAGTDTRWLERPGEAQCASCHESEMNGFSAGKHGMRLASGLPRVTPDSARLPMKAEAGHRALTCTSCHGAHGFETRRAAVEACLGCHDDRHTRAYRDSPHRTLWARETSGGGAAGSGVSCATCHLPREHQRVNGTDIVVVQHNQNANLRPNEKMVRTVCLACHGLGFSLDALADPSLVAANFKGRPVRSVAGIEMAVRRVARPADDIDAKR